MPFHGINAGSIPAECTYTSSLQYSMYLALLTLPLSTFVCLGLFGRFVGARGTLLLSVFSAIGSALISLAIFYEVALCGCPCQMPIAVYFSSGLFDASFGLLFDTLTAVMGVVITLISCLVIVYSCSYMIEDPHFIRFLSYLTLFTFAMLVLVTADNFIQLFVGWELVGFVSFLLISFWFPRLQASKAAIQAMLLNRVGDIGLALGISCLFYCYKTTNYQALFCINGLDSSGIGSVFGISFLDWACLFLFLGAMGKSGQFGLHIWLPNAMNAPTPVSALLHAATMVTAGVFLLARSSPLLEYAPNAGAMITIIGAITTVFAGTVGLVQNDLKSIIAFSTISQLGYMITICGLSNYNVGIFHLFNHSFFKALLFLTAGAIIHAMGNQQDIRKFGGLQQILVLSYTALLIGTLALVGTPFLTGFYSKDVILELAYARYSLSANFSYVLTSFSVLTTSYYSFRLLFMCFHSFPSLSKTTNVSKESAKHVQDADWVMALVLILLALGSIFAGWLFKPMFIGLGTDFWNNSLVMKQNHSLFIEAEFLPPSVKWLPLANTIMGAFLAYLFTMVFVKKTYDNTIKYVRPFYVFLNQRWFYDKLVNELIGYPSFNLGFRFLKVFDKGLLELLPIFGLGLPRSLKVLYVKLGEVQSGLIYHYAAVMVFAALCALTFLSFDDLQLFVDFRLGMLMFAAVFVL
jgi:NADH-ubiquinone oxidoreductase chain 5